MDVEAAGRRPKQVAEVLEDGLVARFLDQGRATRVSARVQPRAERPEARFGHLLARRAQLLQHLAGGVADAGLQLDLFGEDL